MNTTTPSAAAPGRFGRFRSRQSGHPSGLIGRIFGRAMVKDTSAANDRALELLELSAQSTVLDLGCGQGRTLAELVRAGHRAVGVDPSATMVKQARARTRSACRRGDVTVLLGDGRTLPLSDDSIDQALTAHTVYFMPDPAATFAEVARALRPGGRQDHVRQQVGSWAGSGQSGQGDEPAEEVPCVLGVDSRVVVVAVAVGAAPARHGDDHVGAGEQVR